MNSPTSTTGSQQDNVDVAAEVAKHIHSGCECRIIEAPITSIEKIRKDGGIPILSIDTNDTDKLEISAKRWNGVRKYVVLTHAVPDGFGFPEHRTITTCQLIRIADRMGKLQVEEVRAELCFWEDTLCSPDETSIVEGVYENAYAVLCFDTRPLPMPRGTSVEDLAFGQYVASLFESHPQLGLHRRLLLVTNQGTIDMHSDRVETPRGGQDYKLDLVKGNLAWRPAHERAERRGAAILRDRYSVLRQSPPTP
ncbi:Hypothetical predicted protein [Lecanosticta acicola]|uniref:Uncharacterized protein n=1 Tax=Lecanosticta acicola TaxID=111012 RepID=A0AAI8W1R5_9PEZI|nr:Hypothetical predicted protein [Lecanosticta acicola]